MVNCPGVDLSDPLPGLTPLFRGEQGKVIAGREKEPEPEKTKWLVRLTVFEL
jgi:hypothetical protein